MRPLAPRAGILRVQPIGLAVVAGARRRAESVDHAGLGGHKGDVVVDRVLGIGLRLGRGRDRFPGLAAILGLIGQFVGADGEAARFIQEIHLHQQLRRLGQFVPFAAGVGCPPDAFGRDHPAQLVVQEKQRDGDVA